MNGRFSFCVATDTTINAVDASGGFVRVADKPVLMGFARVKGKRADEGLSQPAVELT